MLALRINLFCQFGQRVVAVGPVAHVGIAGFGLAAALVIAVGDGVAGGVLGREQIAEAAVAAGLQWVSCRRIFPRI